jgi:ribonuclease R
MRIAPDGTVTAADVYATRIRSNTRLSYETAAAVLAGQRPEEVADDVLDALRWLRTAAARLGVQRLRRGGVEARRVEPELTVEVVEGEAATVAAKPSNPANLLIERLMVAANESVAGWLVDRGLPGIFRVHPSPAPTRPRRSRRSARRPATTPASAAPDAARPRGAVGPAGRRGDDTASAVWDVLLGFLGRASYTPVAGGHFGLASSGYSHFTSPIRRYADLAVHRVLHAYLGGSRDAADFPTAAEMSELCGHINTAARTASQAENQMRKSLWLAELASADPARPTRRGSPASGPKGIFVTLDRSRVSGMSQPASCPAGLGADRRRARAGRRAGHRLGYGDLLTVRITKADWESGQLELALEGPTPPRERSSGRTRSGSGTRPRKRAAAAPQAG